MKDNEPWYSVIARTNHWTNGGGEEKDRTGVKRCEERYVGGMTSCECGGRASLFGFWHSTVDALYLHSRYSHPAYLPPNAARSEAGCQNYTITLASISVHLFRICFVVS